MQGASLGLGQDESQDKAQDDEENDEEILEEEEDDGTDVSGNEIEEIKDYIRPPLNLLESTAKGAQPKRVEAFGKILTFIDLNKNRKSSTGCYTMPIPMEARAYTQIWGTKENVINGIRKMLQIGLIEKHRNYDFQNHKATIYKFIEDNAKEFVEYCQEQGIKKWIPASWNVKKLTKEEKEQIPFNNKDVIFSYDLQLVKPLTMTKSAFIEKWIMPCLYENYPWFGMWRDKIRHEINEIYERTDKDLSLFFEPSFTWTTANYKKTGIKKVYLRKIGIRLSNRLVGLADKESDERTSYRKKMGFRLEKDIKSSIPRVTKSLHNLEWIDESVDIYELINNELEPAVEFTPYRRSVIKELRMRAYFDNKSDQNIGKNIIKFLRDNDVDVTKIVKKDIDEAMGKLRQAMIKAEDGEPFGSEVFYVESIIYLLTTYDLMMSGHLVYFVFDCFYSTGNESQEQFNEIVSSGVKINFEFFLRDFLGIQKTVEKTGVTVEEVFRKLEAAGRL